MSHNSLTLDTFADTVKLTKHNRLIFLYTWGGAHVLGIYAFRPIWTCLIVKILVNVRVQNCKDPESDFIACLYVWLSNHNDWGNAQHVSTLTSIILSGYLSWFEMLVYVIYEPQTNPGQNIAKLSTHSWNLPKVIKKCWYFHGCIFIRKAELMLQRFPWGDSNNVLTEIVNR